MSATGALLGSPILRSQGMTGEITSRDLTLQPGKAGRPPQMTGGTGKWPQWRARRSLPSYISAGSISEAVIDLLVPNSAGDTTMTEIQKGIKALPDWMPTFKDSLQALANNAGKDIDLFRTSVENWYDDHMSRVSGWYKRHVAKITIVIGAILVLLLNINTLTIGRTLYSNSVVRTAVSTVAAKTTSCQGKTQQECLAGLQSQLSAAAQAGLPIGWGNGRRLRGAEGIMQLAGPAGHLQPPRRLALAGRARPHRLPDHDHRAHAGRPVLVRPPGQARQPPLDRPQARRANPGGPEKAAWRAPPTGIYAWPCHGHGDWGVVGR